MYDMVRAVIYYSIGCIIILLLLTLLVSNGKLRYCIKLTFYNVIITTSAIVCIPYMLLRPKDWRNAMPVAWCINLCNKIVGISFLVRGKENIVKDSSIVMLINHQSVMDLCALAELSKLLRKCSIIAKKEILYFGPFGLLSWLVGTIFIDRRRRENAQDTMKSIVKLIKESNINVILFPEGRRNSNPTLMPFKKGGFHLAIDSQVPIQPVVISKYYFYSSKSMRFDSGASCITILPSISTKGMKKENIPMLVATTHKIMNKVFHETTEEMLNKHTNSLKDK